MAVVSGACWAVLQPAPPPRASPRRHYGHILAGTIKDIVTRYATQTGHHVERRFGWDCHGLPVEFEIDKKLGVRGRCVSRPRCNARRTVLAA